MKLYQLNEQYQQLLDAASAAESDDDKTAFADTLEGMQGEIGEKVLGCAAVVKTLDAQAAVVKAESDRLAKKSKAISSNATNLKAYMQMGMETANLPVVKGDLFTVAIQANPPACVIDNEEMIPGVYKRVETTTSIARKEILDALKTGREIPGAHMEQGKSLRIK